MKTLKTFLDVTGRRVNRGEPVSKDYDKATLAHYTRLGLISADSAESAPAPGTPTTPTRGRPRKLGPAETKPAAPQETKPAAPAEAQTAALVDATAPADLVALAGPADTAAAPDMGNPISAPPADTAPDLLAQHSDSAFPT